MDEDIQKTMLRIEKILAAAFPQAKGAIGGGRPASRNDPVQATAKAQTRLADTADGLNKQFGRLDRSVRLVTGSFGKLNGKLTKGVVQPTTSNAPASISPTAALNAQLNSAAGAASGLAKQLTSTLHNFAAIGFSVKILKNLIEGPVLDAYRDVIRLQSRGIGGWNNIASMSIAAAKAGMSIEEYTSLLENNSVAVSRATSFEAFNKQMDSTKERLGELGVIGSAARNLSATMMSSATTLGVPQAQLSTVMDQQIDVFKQLRDTTMLTADGFKELVADLSSNINVQEELLGMAPQERQARLNQLMQTAALGHQMGLTKEQSRALTESLLAQRKMTAVERFKAQGAIRLGGAITGMNAGETDELARLALKRNRSADENLRFVQLGGQYKQRLEEMANSGNIQAENIYDQLSALLPGGTQSQLDAAGMARLAQESGTAGANKDFSQSVSKFGQAINDLAVLITGAGKTPVIDMLKGLVPTLTSLVGYFLLSKKIGAIAGVAAQGKAASPALSAIGRSLTQALQAPLNLAKQLPTALGSSLKTATSSISSAATAASRYGNAVRLSAAMTSNSSALLKVAGDGISMAGRGARSGLTVMQSALGGITKLFTRAGPLAFIFSTIEEAFTGEMASALGLGDGVFGRILGAVVAGFNGIFTGITRLFDESVNWLFKGLGIDFSVNTTKLVDYTTSLLVDFFKMIGSVFMKGLAGVLELLPFVKKDAPFIKALRENAGQVDSSIAESSANRQKMWNTEGATLRSIGEKNLKAQESIQAKTEETAKRTAIASGRIVDGIDQLASAASRTADQAQSGVLQASQVAMPGPTQRASVTSPEVNKPQVDEKRETAVDASGKPQVVSAPDVVAILQQQLELQRALLVRLAEGGAESARAVRSSFPSTTELAPLAFGA
jgi:hypothetical protein